AEAETHARSKTSLREQLDAALVPERSAAARAAEAAEARETEPAPHGNNQRTGADVERRIAELTRAVDAKAKELQRESQARLRLVREAEDRLNEMEDRARNSEERAEHAEDIARWKAEEAEYVRRIKAAEVRVRWSESSVR